MGLQNIIISSNIFIRISYEPNIFNVTNHEGGAMNTMVFKKKLSL